MLLKSLYKAKELGTVVYPGGDEAKIFKLRNGHLAFVPVLAFHGHKEEFPALAPFKED